MGILTRYSDRMALENIELDDERDALDRHGYVIEDACEDSEMIQNVVITLDKQVINNDEALAPVKVALEGFIKSRQLLRQPQLSHAQNSLKYARESLSETMTNIFNAIMAYIRRLIAWGRKVISQLFGRKAKTAERVEKTLELIDEVKDVEKEAEKAEKIREGEKALAEVAAVLEAPNSVKTLAQVASEVKKRESTADDYGLPQTEIPLSGEFKHLRLNGKPVAGMEMATAFQAMIHQFDSLRNSFLNKERLKRNHDLIVEAMKFTGEGSKGKKSVEEIVAQLDYLTISGKTQVRKDVYWAGVQMYVTDGEPFLGDARLSVKAPKDPDAHERLKTLPQMQQGIVQPEDEIASDIALEMLKTDQAEDLMTFISKLVKRDKDDALLKDAMDRLSELEGILSAHRKAVEADGQPMSNNSMNKFHALIRYIDHSFIQMTMTVNAYETMMIDQATRYCHKTMQNRKALTKFVVDLIKKADARKANAEKANAKKANA